MQLSSLGDQFNRTNSIQNQIIQNNKELSSGKKSRTKDVAGAASADRLEAKSRGLSQALRNIDQARGVIEQASSGVQAVSESLSRIKELTIQFKNTTNADDQAAIQLQIDGELEGINTVATQKDSNGNQLLQGAGNVEIQVGDDAGDTIVFSGSNLQTDGLGINGFDPSAANALDQLSNASHQVQIASSKFGATENRLDASANAVSNRAQASEAARSRIEDTDFAEALAEKTKNEILLKTSLALGAQANADGASLFSLLRSAPRR